MTHQQIKNDHFLKKFLLEWKDYVFALGVLVTCNALALGLSGTLELTNLLMIYLAGILIVVSRTGKSASIFTCLLGVLSFDFFIVPPRFSFSPTDSQYLITLAVVLLFTLTISEQMAKARRQTQVIRQKEERAEALYDLSCELAASQDMDRMLETAVGKVAEIFSGRVGILIPDTEGHLFVRVGQMSFFNPDSSEQKAASWAHKFGKMAGPGMGNFDDIIVFYLPLVVSGNPVGVLALEPTDKARSLTEEQLHLLQALTNQIGASLQNIRLSAETQAAHLKAEMEELRSALLSSVSHDLRTPLAVITGSASSLLDPGSRLNESARQELAKDIYNESERLNRLLSNLLEMTRLSAGKVILRKELQPLEEVVGAALSRMEKKLAGRRVEADFPESLPMLPLDSLLMEQVFINLIENALKYTPPGSTISLSAHVRRKDLKVRVEDSGPGLAEGDEDKIFEKFYRGKAVAGQSGVGLGLSICRAVVEAHGGRIWAENRPEGGASFNFSLPLEDNPVSVEREPSHG